MKTYLFSFKVVAYNKKEEKIIDGIYQNSLKVEKLENGEYPQEETYLTKSNVTLLTANIINEITSSLSNQQLTKEMQERILPDWEKSSVTPIGYILFYEDDKHEEDTSNS